MMLLGSFRSGAQAAGLRTGPPVGPVFVSLAGTMTALVVIAGFEINGGFSLPIATSGEFGVMAATTFVLASVLAAYRAIASHKPWAAAIAVVLMGPGAVWSWSTFVAGEPPVPAVMTLVVLSSAGLALVLLVKGLRMARWLEVFGGLGALGLSLATAVVRLDPGAAAAAAGPALLAAVAGMTCLYGLLVDLEVDEYRSFVELLESQRHIEDEVARVEDLLHDVRNGLLAIETAVGSFQGDLAGPLRSEAARLRRLTLTGDRTPQVFDLGSRVRELVAARRGAGVSVVLLAPEDTAVWGEESEILAVIDNLVSNAERHGRAGPILVELTPWDDGARLMVTNEGHLPAVDPESLFTRGVTTHPAGSGLGLGRARMLAAVNGADLRVGPAEVGYTTFVLTLRSEPPAAVA